MEWTNRNIHHTTARVTSLLLGLCLLFSSCSLDDDRDLCCGNMMMEIKYVPYGVEEFSTYIHSLRHFVFDANGRYVNEIAAGSDLQRLRFSLPDGDYTMLTLGNADTPLAFKAEDQTLESLEVELSRLTPSGRYLNADQLYWGVCDMHVDQSRENRFVTYMNNIHCHLHVKVMWHNMPSDVGDYRMELRQVPVGYSLCPQRSQVIGDKVIPAPNGDVATHVQRTPLKSQELRDEFITMRYTRQNIPTYQLWFGDKAITGPIDLSRAFRTWGWDPEATAVQEYRIQLTIYADGTVEVRPWVDADIEDWQDGGSFS